MARIIKFKPYSRNSPVLHALIGSDEIKTMSRGFSWVMKVANTRNRVWVCSFLITENEELFISKKIIPHGWKHKSNDGPIMALRGSDHCYLFGCSRCPNLKQKWREICRNSKGIICQIKIVVSFHHLFAPEITRDFALANQSLKRVPGWWVSQRKVFWCGSSSTITDWIGLDWGNSTQLFCEGTILLWRSLVSPPLLWS